MVIGAGENPLTHRNQFRLLAVKEFWFSESSLSGFAAVKLSEFLQISGILDPLHLVGLYIVQHVCSLCASGNVGGFPNFWTCWICCGSVLVHCAARVQPVCACVLKPFANVRILGSALDLQFSYVLDPEPGLETRSGSSEIP